MSIGNIKFLFFAYSQSNDFSTLHIYLDTHIKNCHLFIELIRNDEKLSLLLKETTKNKIQSTFNSKDTIFIRIRLFWGFATSSFSTIHHLPLQKKSLFILCLMFVISLLSHKPIDKRELDKGNCTLTL